MVPTGIQKIRLSSVLKALALEVLTVGWLSRYSHIQGIEEIMQHIYADQSVHRWSVNASVIFSVSSLRHVCQLSTWTPPCPHDKTASWCDMRGDMGAALKQKQIWLDDEDCLSGQRLWMFYIGASSSIGSSSALRKRYHHKNVIFTYSIMTTYFKANYKALKCKYYRKLVRD